MPKPPANAIDQHIGKRLKLLRESHNEEDKNKKGLSSAKAADLIGATPQQYSRYELGKNKMSVAQLYHLALYFKVPMSWFLIGLEGEASSTPYDPVSDADKLAILIRHWPSLAPDQKAVLLKLVDSYLAK